MSYLNLPGPIPSVDDAPFWDYCQQRELRIQRCSECGKHRHPPGPVCPKCRSRDCEWDRSNGKGTLFSYSIIHHGTEAVRAQLPYNVAIVQLDDCGGVRLVSNVIGDRSALLSRGMKLSLTWDTASDAQCLPRFEEACR